MLRMSCPHLEMLKDFHHSELSQATWPQATGESNAAKDKTRPKSRGGKALGVGVCTCAFACDIWRQAGEEVEMGMLGQVLGVHVLHLPQLPRGPAGSLSDGGHEVADGRGLGAALLGLLFLQRAALQPESCHILFFSWGDPEGQVRGGTQVAGGWAPVLRRDVRVCSESFGIPKKDIFFPLCPLLGKGT